MNFLFALIADSALIIKLTLLAQHFILPTMKSVREEEK